MTNEQGAAAAPKFDTREAWLLAATERLRLSVFKGIEVPPVRISCSWPSSGGTSPTKRTIGQCHFGDAVPDGIPQISISPVLTGYVPVLETVVHELIHAANPEAKHGRRFAKIAKAVGLEGRPTATRAGDELRVALTYLGEALGPYPHTEINLKLKKKQSTRMHKVLCPLHPEGIYRASKKSISHLPLCGVCGTVFIVEGGGFAAPTEREENV